MLDRIRRFFALAPMLVGCVTTNAPNPLPQRAATEYVTIYCAPANGGDAYTIAMPAEFAKCRDGDASLTREEYERRQPDGAQFQAFMASRAPSVPPAKEWTSASQPGDGSIFSFRDWNFGDALERQFGGYLIGRTQPGRPHCDLDYQVGKTWCVDRSIMRRSSSGDQQAYLGDIRVDGLTYFFLDRKLYGFSLDFPTPAYERVAAELSQRYGKPHRTGTDVVVNRAGARFDVKTETWETPHGPMVVRSRGEAVNTGTVLLFDSAALAEIERRGQALTPKPRSIF